MEELESGVENRIGLSVIRMGSQVERFDAGV